MRRQELDDLSYADALVPHSGELAPDETYDGAHFDQLAFDDPVATGSRFLECAFTRVSFQGGQLRRARFADVWLRDVRLVATGLAETSWLDATFDGGIAAGVEAFGATMRRVTFQGCKLDSVNFRDAALTEVTFDDCALSDVDFAGATLTAATFRGSRLSTTNFGNVTLDRVDLRGAELGITIGPGSLRGAIVSAAQLVDIADVLAESMGITVEND